MHGMRLILYPREQQRGTAQLRGIVVVGGGGAL